MEIITVDANNIEQEHICCALSDAKGAFGSCAKKSWLKARFKEGLVFKKLNVRGKVFIEYLPAENAWAPVLAPDYLYINCFWVSGQYKGQGYANMLLNECIADAKIQGKKGLAVLSSDRKQPFLSDPRYLKYKGFQIADTAVPYFELLYLPFEESAPKPSLKNCAKKGSIARQGLVLYYTDQCPHAGKYATLLQEIAQGYGLDFTLFKIENAQQAQEAPTPYTTYSLFYHGCFITQEIFSEKKFVKFLRQYSLID